MPFPQKTVACIFLVGAEILRISCQNRAVQKGAGGAELEQTEVEQSSLVRAGPLPRVPWTVGSSPESRLPDIFQSLAVS